MLQAAVSAEPPTFGVASKSDKYGGNVNSPSRLGVALGLFVASTLTPLSIAKLASAESPPTPDSPVELERFTTETTQVLENGDGTYELTSHRDAVRVNQDGDWVDVNTSLAPVAGRVAPAATTVDLTFSAGGSGPLVIMGEGANAYSLAWEGELPTPTIEGASATYADVRPGTDLVMTATSSGFTQHLVISDSAAAEDLLEQPARLVATSDTLTFESAADGSSTVKDPQGAVLFTGAPPVMWDSSGEEQPSAQDPADGRVTLAAAEVTAAGASMEITVAPPEAAIEDPSTEYPLFLDPTMTRPRQSFLTVHENGWTYFNDSSQDMRVGYCGWSTCNDSYQKNANSFFNFNIDALAYTGADPVIHSAAVTVRQTHNATAAAQPVTLRKATQFGADTEYPGPLGAVLQEKSSAAGWGSTAEDNIVFDNDAVRDHVETVAENEASLIRFALRAPNKGVANQWKKFDNNPKLVVKYSFKPTIPAISLPNAIQCTGHPVYVPGAGVKLRAKSSTQGPAGLKLKLQFQLYTAPYAEGKAATKSGDVTSVASGQDAVFSAGNLSDGQYVFRARAVTEDPDAPNAVSDWSGFQSFTVRDAVPGTVSAFSPTHPRGTWGAAANSPTEFHFTASGNPVGFTWSVTGEPPTPALNNCNYSLTSSDGESGYVPAGGKLVIPSNRLTPNSPVTLKVKAFGRSLNLSSAVTEYPFHVSPNIGGDGKNLIELEDKHHNVPAGVNVTKIPYSGTGGFASRITAPSGLASRKVDYQFTAQATGYHALGLRFGLEPTGGEVKLTLTDPGLPGDSEDDTVYQIMNGGTPYVLPMGGSSMRMWRSLSEYLPHDGVLFKQGRTYTLTVELLGSGSTALVDSLVAAPIRHGSFNSLSEAFDNQAIGYPLTGGTSPQFAIGAGAAAAGSFHDDALRAAGFALKDPASTNDAAGQLVLGGATFTVPTRTSVEAKYAWNNQAILADNVVSMGQTINMPQTGDRGEAIYLLAAATCKDLLNNSPGRQLTVQYRVVDPETSESNLATSDMQLMSVPSWDKPATGPTIDLPASLTTPTYLNGAAVLAGNRTMYVLRFPIHNMYAGEEVTQVTLPQVGTNYSNVPCGAEGSQALHVFAMTVGD